MDEVNVEPINVGDEVGQGIEPRFHLAPVVLCRPIARQLLSGCEPHALRVIRYLFLVRPLGRVDAPAQVGELRFRSMEREGTDFVFGTHLRNSLLGWRWSALCG